MAIAPTIEPMRGECRSSSQGCHCIPYVYGVCDWDDSVHVTIGQDERHESPGTVMVTARDVRAWLPVTRLHRVTIPLSPIPPESTLQHTAIRAFYLGWPTPQDFGAGTTEGIEPAERAGPSRFKLCAAERATCFGRQAYAVAATRPVLAPKTTPFSNLDRRSQCGRNEATRGAAALPTAWRPTFAAE
jgi:hypothetical protein